MDAIARFARRQWRLGIGVAVIAAAFGASLFVSAQGNAQSVVDAAFDKYKTLKEGKHADYSPALAKVDPDMAVNIEHEDQELDQIAGLQAAARTLLEAAE